MNLDSELLEILACPACKSALRVDDPASELVCTDSTCGYAYPVRDDIPVLLVDEARKPSDDTSEDDAAEADASAASSDATSSSSAPYGAADGAAGKAGDSDSDSDGADDRTDDKNDPSDQNDQNEKDGEARP